MIISENKLGIKRSPTAIAIKVKMLQEQVLSRSSTALP